MKTYGFSELYPGMDCVYTDEERGIVGEKVVVRLVTSHIALLECTEGKKKGLTWTPCDRDIIMGICILTCR